MTQDPVTNYFDKNALEWAKHYEKGHATLELFNRVFRRGLKQRWESTMRRCHPARDRTFLDVGCGTGVYSLTLAKAGAAQVTGIDSAAGMIEVCRNTAKAEGVGDRCTFLQAFFMDHAFTEAFDVVFAMGVFDYVTDYKAFWNRMIEVSKGAVIGSFPTYTFPRAPVRTFRYRLKGLPVYFYEKTQVEELGRAKGLARFEIDHLNGGYVLAGYK